MDWLIEEKGVVINGTNEVISYRIDYSDNSTVIDDWALHIRRNYIKDQDLIESASINGLTIEQYLKKYIIPQKGEPLGATARSGDIAEIVVSDLLEFVMGYTVPRYKQMNRSGKNNSEHGTDIIGYKFYKIDKSPNDKDELVATEVKAELTSESYDPLKCNRNEVANNVCRNTLAYSLANDQEKNMLEVIFEAITKKISHLVGVDIHRYSSSMAGVELSKKIEKWLTNVDISALLISEKYCLKEVIAFYKSVYNIGKHQDCFELLCNLWIDGVVPHEMSRITGINVFDTDDVCNKKISYELNFLIGNICDMLFDCEETEFDKLKNMLNILQKKVKYGVASQTAISICETIFYDRILAMRFTNIIGDDDISSEKILEAIAQHKEEIFESLAQYPAYFEDRLKFLLQ